MKKEGIGRLRRVGQSVNNHDWKRHGMAGMKKGKPEE
jgi:hypothetical protein